MCNKKEEYKGFTVACVVSTLLSAIKSSGTKAFQGLKKLRSRM